MNLKQIDNDYFVSEQITVEDIDAIKATGINSIICNRPDGEVTEQPLQSDIEEKAVSLGMKYRFIPVASANAIPDEDVKIFKQAFTELPKPVLAYCRSGTRSTTIWSFANAEEMDADEILAKASAGGYDISPHLERINNGGKL